jgi:hypothetical protein
MLAKRIFLLLALLTAAVLGGGCTEDGDNTVAPPASSAGIFKDVRTFLQQPSLVQFTFRISDDQNHAIIIDPALLPTPFRIFEDEEEIDYSETSYFVHPSTSLELDMVLLLDFTNSMASWEEDGKTGIGLEVDWAHQVIDQLAPTHRMAIMEYHDRNVDAGLIAPFSSDKAALRTALDAFAARAIDHGSSRVWDALHSAVTTFDGAPGDNKQRTVFFISDGKETSSDMTPADVITIAKQWRANVFVIGAGSVANEASLRSVATQTSGEYYPAADIEAFRTKLEQITRDLGGQYKLSYITLKRSGMHQVRVDLQTQGLSGSFDTTLDLGSIYGDDRIGVITFDAPTLQSNTLSVVVRAQHIPRNIDRFRFKLDTTKPYTVALPPATAGGLCESWTVSGPDIGGFMEITSTAPLKFGDFGPLFQIMITEVTATAITIPFIMDISIYADGKTFTYPASIVYGAP